MPKVVSNEIDKVYTDTTAAITITNSSNNNDDLILALI